MEGRYQPYQRYQDSYAVWSGKVPEHWRSIRLKHVFSEKKKCQNPKLPAGSISFGNVVFKNENGLAKETKAAYQELLSGEFLVNPLNMNFDLLSLRTALSAIDVVVSTGYLVLQSVGGYNKNYLRWLLQQFDVSHMKTLGAGVRQTISFTDIGNCFIFEPPLPEQSQIADFLDHETAKIDALIAKQQRLITLLEEKRQAVISHAVTKGLNPDAPLRPSGIDWLGDVPGHWNNRKLNLLINTRKGVAFKADDFCDEGVRVAKASDIKNLTLKINDVFLPTNFAKKYPKAILTEGNIVLSTVGSNPDVRNSAVGQVARVPRNQCGSLLNQNTVVFEMDSFEAREDFVFAILQTRRYRDHLDLNAHGTANQSSLNVDDMLNFFVPLPDGSEQARIVAHLEKRSATFDDLSASSNLTIALLKERRTALISAAVTGKIDVRDWRPSNFISRQVSETIEGAVA